MEQTKLTAKEIIWNLLKSFFAIVIYMQSIIMLTGICGLNTDVLSIIFWLAFFLYFNYLMFVLFHNSKRKMSYKIGGINKIKKALQSVQLRKIIVSKNTLSFILTIFCGTISMFGMTIGAILADDYFFDPLRDWLHLRYSDSDPSGWSGLGIVVMTFVMSGIISCVFAKWIALRTHNDGVKWAAILPIILIDLYALFVLIGTPIEMLIRVLEGKPPLH